MPPKKPATSKKTEQKKKEKVIEDKTFGLKNKKGAKQQKFIQHVNKNVKQGGDPLLRKQEEVKKKEKDKKEEANKQKEFLKEIFKPVVEKVDKSVDPKSVVCPYYKQGLCDKGAKCKYAHDLNVARKTEKRNIYVDSRDEAETSGGWDQDKLKAVIDSKQDESERSKPKTQIICKYFLDAVESNKYGWFWQCPSGDKCIYRHALPEGYVLKRDQKKPDKKDDISIEDLVEKERAALGYNLTKITYTTFLQWKKKKLIERRKEQALKNAKKKKDFKSGKSSGLSGRDMFLLNPDMDDGVMEEGDVNVDLTTREQEDEDVQERVKAWTLRDVQRVQMRTEDQVNQTDGASAAADVQIDEQLFDAEDEDLDGLELELDELDVADQ